MWLQIIEKNLTELRLYAAVLCGCATRGDQTVEAALTELLDSRLDTAPDLNVIFQLIEKHAAHVDPGSADAALRSVARQLAADCAHKPDAIDPYAQVPQLIARFRRAT